MARRRSSGGVSEISEISVYEDVEEYTQNQVSAFINEERRKPMSPRRNSSGYRSFLGSLTGSPNSIKEQEDDEVLSWTKVVTQADINTTGLSLIAEKEKEQDNGHDEKVFEIPLLDLDPIGTYLIDCIYYLTSFVV